MIQDRLSLPTLFRTLGGMKAGVDVSCYASFRFSFHLTPHMSFVSVMKLPAVVLYRTNHAFGDLLHLFFALLAPIVWKPDALSGALQGREWLLAALWPPFWLWSRRCGRIREMQVPYCTL